MIDKLRLQYSNLVVQTQIPEDKNKYWFVLDDGSYLGIDKQDMSEKDRDLLAIFLSPVKMNDYLSVEQSFWKEITESFNENQLNVMKNYYPKKFTFRFIHFFIHDEVDSLLFEEAVSSLLQSSPVLLWHDRYRGIIIEKLTTEWTEQEELQNLQEAITSDFYTDLDMYIGSDFSLEDSIQEIFAWEKQCFDTARIHSKRRGIFRFAEVVPFLLLDNISEQLRLKITSHVLKGVTEEDLKTIKVFIECGLNTSLAAKQLFMHRNSLQYRVDKFIEKTGIDIKTFQGALVVYLSILSFEF